LWPLKRSSSSQQATAAQEDQNNKEMLSQKNKTNLFCRLCLCCVLCAAAGLMPAVDIERWVCISLLLLAKLYNTKNSLTENKNLKKNFSRFSAAASSVPSARPVDQERLTAQFVIFPFFEESREGGRGAPKQIKQTPNSSVGRPTCPYATTQILCLLLLRDIRYANRPSRVRGTDHRPTYHHEKRQK
jgi:hypothetical protein